VIFHKKLQICSTCSKPGADDSRIQQFLLLTQSGIHFDIIFSIFLNLGQILNHPSGMQVTSLVIIDMTDELKMMEVAAYWTLSY
jgi:hypothetical protein